MRRAMSKCEHQPIVAKQSQCKEAATAPECDRPHQKQDALGQLDNPTILQHLREYFEFLGSAELHHCRNPWPKAGELTAGKLAASGP